MWTMHRGTWMTRASGRGVEQGEHKSMRARDRVSGERQGQVGERVRGGVVNVRSRAGTSREGRNSQDEGEMRGRGWSKRQ